MTIETIDRGPSILKGTIWRSARGVTVEVHENSHAGIVRYHKLPDGELHRLSVLAFLERYAELRS